MADIIPIPDSARFQDLTGRRFGRLTVTGYAGMRGATRRWRCSCDCGTEKEIGGEALLSGGTRSCRCLHREIVSAMSRSSYLPKPAKSYPEYKVWSEMKRRCYNAADESFDGYGGRGISVCDRWKVGEGGLSGFECFISDMGQRPTSKHSVERRENDQGYGPNNCFWADQITQARNKRSNVWVSYQGTPRLLIELCEEIGAVSYSCAYQRINTYGWLSIEDAVSIPPKNLNKRKRRE